MELKTLQADIWDLPLPQLIQFWDALEKKHGIDAVRELCKVDRYYLLVRACGRADALHPWLYARCREVERNPNDMLDLWAREHYKDLADDTPMLTANRGWTTHGELMPGDYVYSDKGIPVKVIAVSDRYTDSECYQVTFQDGASIVCGAGHLWRLRQKVRHRVTGTDIRRISWHEDVVQTIDINLSKGRPDVGVCDVLEMPQQELLIDPYVLGCWLGDGHSAGGSFTCAYTDHELIENMRSKGASVTEVISSNKNTGLYRLDAGIRGKRGTGMTALLRLMGLKNNKHIPKEYMYSSVSQRFALLKGLMDTDGHCNKMGTATFCQASSVLANQVYDLATSLGLRPRIRHYDNDKKGYYQVSFQAHTDRNPFLLSRKANRAISKSEHRNCRNIVKIEKVASVPTKCIQVEGGMYAAGRELIPTHNSTIITFAGAIQEILKDPEITIAIFSHTKGIARKFFRQIKYELESNRTLLNAFPDVLWENPRQAPRWAEETGLVVKRKNNPKEATLESWGLVDGQPTSAHFMLRIYDDVVSPESVTTPDQINKTTASWELSDNLGANGGKKWHVGTRYHFGDTYNSIMKRGALTPRLHAATDNGQPDGKPVLLTQEQWEDKKIIQGPATIACQMLQNPIAGQQAMFDVTDLQTYEIRPQTLNVYILVDPARSMKKGSANTAISVLGIDSARNKYLLDGINHRLDLKGRWEAVKNMRAVWINKMGVQGVWVGYESFGALADLDYFRERMEVEQISFPIEELTWPRDGEGSKDDRVQRLGPDLRAHKFFLPSDTKTLTSNQERCKNTGQEYRIAKPIKKRDSDGNIYDLSVMLKEQVMFYPFAPLKDLIDATSRIYDMNPRPPIIIDESMLEPEATVD